MKVVEPDYTYNITYGGRFSPRTIKRSARYAGNGQVDVWWEMDGTDYTGRTSRYTPGPTYFLEPAEEAYLRAGGQVPRTHNCPEVSQEVLLSLHRAGGEALSACCEALLGAEDER